MELFSRIIQKLIENGQLSYHPKCKDLSIRHICFADYLFILCFPTEQFFQIVSLFEFHKYLGLQVQPKNGKSKIYIAGTDNQNKLHLAAIRGFELGTLPARYLGVPLFSTKLSIRDCRDCNALIDKSMDGLQKTFHMQEEFNLAGLSYSVLKFFGLRTSFFQMVSISKLKSSLETFLDRQTHVGILIREVPKKRELLM